MIDTGPYTHDGLAVATLFEDLSEAAANALAETPDGLPEVWGYFHDRPVEDCCDAMQLWCSTWVPVIPDQFPAAATAVDVCRGVEMMPRMVLSLRRPCAPQPDAQGNVDPADETEMALRLAVDFRAVVCAVARDWPGILQARYPHARLFYGNATAQGANTDCHGWDWEIMVELSGCKAGCGQ